MFLSIQKHTLPVVSPKSDGVTFLWPFPSQGRERGKKPLLSNIKIPMTETLPIYIFISYPIAVPLRAIAFECILDGCAHDYYCEAVEFYLQIIYSACRSYSPEYEGLVQNITIESVLVRLKSKDVIPIWSGREKHRMVATLKKEARAERISLGRAQMIRTEGTPQLHFTRTYTWMAFPHKDTTPMDHILDAPPPFNISPRLEAGVSAEVDHDGFSNLNSVLPITLLPESVVTLQFFNLKDKPPRFLEWPIRWSALMNHLVITSPSAIVRKITGLKLTRKSGTPTSPREMVFKESLTNYVEASLSYKILDMDSIVVYEVRLNVSHYLEALEAMNDAIMPKTI